jgi:hypothetical protein
MVALQLALVVGVARAAWPDLSSPAPSPGGEDDAALIVAIEDYAFVADVPGAKRNGLDWYAWLTDGRGVPPERVRLLADAEGTREEVLAALAALQPADGGQRWVVFIGHGAPTADGHDGLLLGADVQQNARSVQARGILRSELVAAAPDAVVVLDACFSGRDTRGAALIPGLQPMIPDWATPPTPTATVLSAGGADEFAGALPGEARPAFSYLVLGALRGWGDADGDGLVTAREAADYASRALQAVLVGRNQRPEQVGADRPLGEGVEAGPDLAAIRVGLVGGDPPAPRPAPAPAPAPAVAGPPAAAGVALEIGAGVPVAAELVLGRGGVRPTLGVGAWAMRFDDAEIAGAEASLLPDVALSLRFVSRAARQGSGLVGSLRGGMYLGEASACSSWTFEDGKRLATCTNRTAFRPFQAGASLSWHQRLAGRWYAFGRAGAGVIGFEDIKVAPDAGLGAGVQL